jgi:hypothetical protein
MHDGGSKITLEWIPVGRLIIDHRYQRPLREPLIASIQANPNPDEFGALDVSRRDNGEEVVLDGQQRREAILRLWGPDELVPCCVRTGMTYEAEAIVFEGNGRRVTVTALDLFKSRLSRQEPQAVELDRVFRRHHLEIRVGVSTKVVQAVAMSEKVLRNAGAAMLDQALGVLVDSKQEDQLSGEMIYAVTLLLCRYPEIDRKRLVRVLVDHPQRRLAGAARSFREGVEIKAGSLGQTVAQMIVVRYNRNLGLASPKRIVWEEPNRSRDYWKPLPEPGKLVV